MRCYELRLVTQEGRKIRGPIFGKKDHQKFVDLIQDIGSFSVFRMTFGKHRIVIPQQVIETGYFHIKPVGLLYTLIRMWRSW